MQLTCAVAGLLSFVLLAPKILTRSLKFEKFSLPSFLKFVFHPRYTLHWSAQSKYRISSLWNIWRNRDRSCHTFHLKFVACNSKFKCFFYIFFSLVFLSHTIGWLANLGLIQNLWMAWGLLFHTSTRNFWARSLNFEKCLLSSKNTVWIANI